MLCNMSNTYLVLEDTACFYTPNQFALSSEKYELFHILTSTWCVHSFSFGHYRGCVVINGCNFNLYFPDH